MTDRLYTAIRETLEPEPLAPHERDQIWAAIEPLAQPPASTPVVPRRRRSLVLAPIGVAVAATLVIALAPGGERAGVSLSDASAAEVLRIAASSAESGGLPLPAPDESLLAVQRRVVPLGAGQEQVETLKSLAATDGNGSLSRSLTSPDGQPFTSTTRFRPGTPADVDAFEDWRGVIATEDLAALPTDPGALLAELRAAVEETVPPGDRKLLELLGADLAVVGIAQSLIIRAPITPEQRAALFEMLASAPSWTVPGTSETPIEVERRGKGQDGIVIGISSRLNAAEQREASTDAEWALELVVDARAGQITELREYEGGLGTEPQVTSLLRQEIVQR